MEKKLVARLNEIGQEIGFPYQILKSGQYQPFDAEVDNSEVSMVVYSPIPMSSRLMEMKKISEDERMVWNELFPNRKDADADAVLSDEEQMKLIIFGRRRTVVNYFKKKVLSKRIARAMVARNDDKLLIEFATANKLLPCFLASAVIKYTSDARFERIINLAVKSGLLGFARTVENKLVKDGREAKFVAYVKAFEIDPATQYVLVHDRKIDLLKTYVGAGRKLCADIENAINFIDSFRDMKVVYNKAKKDFLAKQ
ncbi:MAG: hypothetical protein IKW39_03435 [Alphaproteobacteria bacterium]|nr:hypothetical protein [Alphaproteobacteria bacterium]